MNRSFEQWALHGTALVLATALHLAVGAAMAQTPSAGQSAAQSPPQSAMKPSLQPYVGVAVGRSSFDIDTTGATRADTSSTGYKLFGGLQFNQFLGLEAAAFNLGKATGAVGIAGLGTVTVEGEVRGVSLAGIATLPLSDAAAVYAKAGVAHMETKATANTALGSASQTNSSAQPLLGVDLRWCFTRSVEGQLEWERVRAPFVDDEKVNTDLISVGLRVRF
jgi:OOP family OmpA-OmpF porin